MVHVCVWPTKGQLAVNKQGKWSIKALVLVVVFVWLLLLRFNLHTQHIHTQHTHTLRETQMCSTLCGARISLPQRRRRRRLRSIELKCAKKKRQEKNTIERQRHTESDRQGHVVASAHQKGLCCCCRCTLYIYLHVDCVSIANWLPGFFHLNCQLLLHWHCHSLAIGVGVAWLQVTVSRSQRKGCQSSLHTLTRFRSHSRSRSFRI